MDEKWKISKKEGSSSNSSKFSMLPRSFSTKSVSSKSPLLRSSSQKNSCSSSSSSSSKCSSLPRSYSQKNPSISRKCTSLAKEQKARFYIMRRCVAMLVCWHKHGDSWRKKKDGDDQMIIYRSAGKGPYISLFSNFFFWCAG